LVKWWVFGGAFIAFQLLTRLGQVTLPCKRVARATHCLSAMGLGGGCRDIYVHAISRGLAPAYA